MKKNYFFIFFLFAACFSYGQTSNDSVVASLQIEQENSFNKTIEIKGFSIFPNPVSEGVLRINTFDNAEKSIQIFDLTGKQVLSRRAVKSQHISVSNLDAGIYILKVSEKGKTATRKLVIK